MKYSHCIDYKNIAGAFVVLLLFYMSWQGVYVWHWKLQTCSPERIGKVNGNAEIAAGFLHAVHTDPQLPRVASTSCKCKNSKKLQRERKRQIVLRLSKWQLDSDFILLSGSLFHMVLLWSPIIGHLMSDKIFTMLITDSIHIISYFG